MSMHRTRTWQLSRGYSKQNASKVRTKKGRQGIPVQDRNRQLEKPSFQITVDRGISPKGASKGITSKTGIQLTNCDSVNK